MIPLRDSVRSSRRPVLIYLIVGINAFVFFYELSLGRGLFRFFYEYGLIARHFWATDSVSEKVVPVVTSMFVHSGWLHFLGNMVFLWVFGDNIEDRMGRVRFLFFYLAAGATAAMAQLYVNPSSTVPMIGASGAIAGVLGAYLRLFPRARVLALVPLFFFFQVLEVRATVFLIFWFVIQFASGALSLAAPSAGGPAFWAHIGGFVMGLVVGPLLARRPQVEVLPPW